jgi:hypothetical protein
MRRVLFEAGKALSFMLSILSLYPIIVSAFFVPGTHWEERLSMALLRIALAACVCFASGLLFAYSPRSGGKSEPLMRTLPVQMFLWTLAGVAVFFVISWYLETYYVPLLWRNQPRDMGVVLRQPAVPRRT